MELGRSAFFRNDSAVSEWGFLEERIHGIYNSGFHYGEASCHAGYYLSMSSPIRKMVDLLNQVLFVGDLGAVSFVDSWVCSIDLLNSSIRSVSKIQRCCRLLHFVEQKISDFSGVFSGLVFAVESGVYSVYLPEFKLFSRFRSSCVFDSLPHKCDFRLFYFKSDFDLKKKIRLVLVE
jgi:hypothetical protein